MAARRLTDADKETILELYRLPGETTSTISSRFGVSTSTISRILKTSLPEAEYEELIQQKRNLRFAGEEAMPSSLEVSVDDMEVTPVAQLEMELSSDPEESNGRRRSRRRSASEPIPEVEPIARRLLEDRDSPLATFEDFSSLTPAEYATETGVNDLLEEDLEDLEDLEEDGDDLEDLEDDLENLEDDLEDDLEEDGEDLEDLDEDLDDDLEAGTLLAPNQFQGKIQVQILPLAEASLPRTCYLVVDRAAELIARPLRDFGDLGQFSEAEGLEKTLPIFDNHRVAKRFSNPRTQRVIKLPDGRVIQKTASHLQAKGITRLLIDGQVYALN